MSKQLAEIFNECVERLQQGDSIENCLMSYPEVAAELEILLRTAVNVHWRASMVQPSPEFKAYARARFIAAQYAAAQERQFSPRPTIFNLQRAWVPALAMVAILVFSSVGTAAAASNAMPDEPLYPVKLATEQVRLTMAFSNEVKAEINVQLVETRSQEITAMAVRGKAEQVAMVAEKLVQRLEAAEQAIAKVEEIKVRKVAPMPQMASVSPPQPSTSPTVPPVVTPTPAPSRTPDKSRSATDTGQEAAPSISSKEDVTSAEAAKLRETLKTTISKNVTALENARDKTPEQAKEALQKAIDMAKARQLQLQMPDKGTIIEPTSIRPATGNSTKPSLIPPATTPKPIPPKPSTQPGTKQPQSTTGNAPTSIAPVTTIPKGTAGNVGNTGDSSKSVTSSTVPNQITETNR